MDLFRWVEYETAHSLTLIPLTKTRVAFVRKLYDPETGKESDVEKGEIDIGGVDSLIAVLQQRIAALEEIKIKLAAVTASPK